MSRTALIFVVIAILAAVAGFAGYAGALGNLVWWAVALFIVLAVVAILRRW